MSNRAWVTLATNDSYGLGALVLAHSLRRVSSAYPAVVLITPTVTEAMRERLRAVFAEVITVDVLDSRDAAHLALLQRPELGITFTKIHCWSLTQYEKCVFLDADTLVVQNSDELFEREEFSAAPDVGWPDCFNSGVFVFSPSAETFSRLIAFAKERGSFDGGDQGLLNSFFSDWARGDISKHLPFLYNVTSAAFYSYLPALKHFGQDLKIIHFIGAAKPWLQHFNFESRTVDAPEHIRGLLQLWWDLFVGQVHTQLHTTMVEVDEPEPPLVRPPHDVSQRLHYQPVLDPESEFPWHRPDNQIVEDLPETHIDMTDVHDPWEIYRGHIPPISEEQSAQHSEAANDNLEEIRKYAWDYQQQEHASPTNNHEQYSRQELYLTPQSTHHHEHHSHNISYQHCREQPPPDNNQSYQHSEQHGSSVPQNDYSHSQQSSHIYPGQSNDHHEHWHHEAPEYSHQGHQHHHEDKHEQNQHHQQSFADNHEQSSQSYADYNSQENQQHNSNHIQHDPDHHGHSHKVHNSHMHSNTHSHAHEAEVRHVQVQLERKRNRRPRRLRIDIASELNGLMNGDISETESEASDDIIPRHPYDGFYLRHRATIDARGRKICSHEIPPTPSTPSPPVSPTSQEYETAEENGPSDDEDQSGVAGNLARVVPGASTYEALDDLTRRQGWEAGNIDYMGADSFDNIWAKISQTLNAPRTSPPKQPSPPKEPSPPAPEVLKAQEAEVPEEPISELVEVAKEAVTVEAPAAATPVEVPAPVEAPVVKEPVVPKEAPVPAPAPAVPAPVAVAAAPQIPETVKAPIELADPTEVPVTVAAEPAAKPKEKTEVAPVQPPKTAAVKAPKAVQAPASLAPASEVPASPIQETPPKTFAVPTDSPPLAHTPSKEEAPAVPAAKSEERRKPAGKLQLRPPSVADPLPTPDSEAEDAAALAHAIIASELRTPTVDSPSTPAPAAPASLPATLSKNLTVEEPEVPTPPVGVSLAQIGVKPKEKTTTAARIESSVAAAEAPAAEASAAEPPKKKLVKKVVKKEAASGEAPVPPPRKKEKKPKEK